MIKILRLASIVLLIASPNAFASNLYPTQTLSFGTLIPLASSGSVSVSSAGAISTNGVVSVAPSGTAYSQGIMRFDKTGLTGIINIATFAVLDSSVTLTNATGQTVTVNNFNPTTLDISLLSNYADFNLGGTMTFNSSSTRGTYTGSVRVRVTYLILNTITTTLPITVTLWNNLTIQKLTDMSFGVMEVTGGNSVVRIDPSSGGRTIISGLSGVVLVPSAPASTAGSFLVAGEPNVQVNITLPTSVTLNGSNGGTMTVTNFVALPGSTSATLNASGNVTLKVGANLNVGAAQKNGTYTGTYNVIVNY